MMAIGASRGPGAHQFLPIGKLVACMRMVLAGGGGLAAQPIYTIIIVARGVYWYNYKEGYRKFLPPAGAGLPALPHGLEPVEVLVGAPTAQTQLRVSKQPARKQVEFVCGRFKRVVGNTPVALRVEALPQAHLHIVHLLQPLSKKYRIYDPGTGGLTQDEREGRGGGGVQKFFVACLL